MRVCAGSILAALVLTPALAAAQPVPLGETPKPPAQPAAETPSPPAVPPGLVPMFPPGATPTAPGAARPAAPPATPPGYRLLPPGYGGYPPPGYAAPSYYPRPYASEGGSDPLPPTLAYEDGETIPHGYQLKSHAVRSYVIAGSVTFGATYLTSVIGAAGAISSGGDGGKRFGALLAPVVGPFVAVGSSSSTGVGTVWLVLDGLAQTGGAVMFIYGLAAEEKYLERASTGRASPLDVIAHPQIFVGGRAAALRWTL